jgi:hypothetical protein
MEESVMSEFESSINIDDLKKNMTNHQYEYVKKLNKRNKFLEQQLKGHKIDLQHTNLEVSADSVDYAKGETPMTDYQFKYLMELQDKAASLEQMNEAIFQLVKTYVEAGKSPEEILAAIEALMKN